MKKLICALGIAIGVFLLAVCSVDTEPAFAATDNGPPELVFAIDNLSQETKGSNTVAAATVEATVCAATATTASDEQTTALALNQTFGETNADYLDIGVSAKARRMNDANTRTHGRQLDTGDQRQGASRAHQT